MNTDQHFIQVKNAKTRNGYIKAMQFLAKQLFPKQSAFTSFDFVINDYKKVTMYINTKSFDSVKRYCNIICMLIPTLTNFDDATKDKYLKRYRHAATLTEKLIKEVPQHRKKPAHVFERVSTSSRRKTETDEQKIHKFLMIYFPESTSINDLVTQTPHILQNMETEIQNKQTLQTSTMSKSITPYMVSIITLIQKFIPTLEVPPQWIQEAQKLYAAFLLKIQ